MNEEQSESAGSLEWAAATGRAGLQQVVRPLAALLGRRPENPEEYLAPWPVSEEALEHEVAARLASEEGDARAGDLLAVGALVLGAMCAAELWAGDLEAAQRLQRVLVERAATLSAWAASEPYSIAHDEPGSFNMEAVLALAAGRLDREARTRLMIDLWFVDPAAPYEIEIKRSVRSGALRQVAGVVGFDDTEFRRIRSTVAAASKAHNAGALRRIGVFGLGGVVIVASGGFLAAPLVAGALGTAAGLGGAAAVAHGLALLGGGTLAAGGAGVTGGMWMVSGIGAAMGAVGGGGGRALYEMGAVQVRVEVVKLQVNYRLLLVDQQVDMAKAQAVLASLDQRISEVTDELERERDLNDANSDRIKDVEDKLLALVNGREWIAAIDPAESAETEPVSADESQPTVDGNTG